MGALLHDLKHSARFLWKNPGFTVVAVIALALGIGANSAIFTVVNAVLLKPLPYPEPERLVRVVRGYRGGGEGSSVSIPKYVAWKRYGQVFESITAYDFAGPGINLGVSDRPEQVRGIHVTAEFFSVFGAQPLMGRIFNAQEDRPGGERVVVLHHGLWVRRFGSDPNIIGKTIKLNDDLYTVVGILRPEFQSHPPAELWMPLQADPNTTNHGHYLDVAARLKPGVTLEDAQAQLTVAAESVRRDIGSWMDKEESITVRNFQRYLTGNIRPALLILLGSVALVLLIACANVANLLLARASGRQREIAVRMAIGASRGQLIRQLLTESALLALAGGVLGLILGTVGLRLLLMITPEGLVPRTSEITSLEPAVLGYTVLISLATAILFGMFPALQLSKPDLASPLKESSSRSGTSLRHNRSRSLLVVVEMALAVVLLIGATLLIRSFAALRNVHPGFDMRNVLTMKISLSGEKYQKTEPVERLFRQLVDRVEALPGVQSAAQCVALPLENGYDLPFTIEGRATTDRPYHGDSFWRPVGQDYFRALGIPLRRGRLFEDRDTTRSAPVVIVNEALAKKHWPKEDPVGQRIVVGRGLGKDFEDPARQIVGVVADTREDGIQRETTPLMYIPMGQTPDGLMRLSNAVLPMSFIVKTTSRPHDLRPAVENEIRSLDGQLAIARVRSMEQVLSDATARHQFNMQLLGIFAGIAMLLAAVGIYGLMSYSVQQRTQEIGIRMALGASRGDMLRLILQQGSVLAMAGVVIGLVGAFGLTRLMSRLLYEVKPTDTATFVVVAVALTLVAVAACYVPARRATKVDPLVALRYE